MRKYFMPVVMGGADPIVVYDTFTDADSTALNSHTPNKSPAAWTHIHGTFQITSNKAVWASKGSPAFALATIDTGVANCTISSLVQRGGTTNPSIAFRAQDKDNCFIVLITSTAFTLVRGLAGTPSVLGTSAKTIAINTDYTVQVVLSGTSIICTIDGGNSISVTDSNFQTATKHGIYAEGAAKWDNYQIIR